MVQKQNLLDAIKNNKMDGKVISLHSSYKSFGGVEGGPNTIIDAFLESGCTLLVPTFTYDYEAYPPMGGKKYKQNGVDLSLYGEDTKVFAKGYSKNNKDISNSMGIIPKLILGRNETIRGFHPLNSFSAIGSMAKELIETQTFLDVYAPFKKCMEIEGSILLLIGVDFRSNTPIHFAEEFSGRNLFRQWGFLDSGEIAEVTVGSCSQGFNTLIPYVKDILKTDTVGQSCWQIYNFKCFITRIAEVIKETPTLTKCENANCKCCKDSILGGPFI